MFRIAILLLFPLCVWAQSLPLHLLKLPHRFKIELYAYPVPDAREMALGDKGTVFVGTKEDKVYAIVSDPISHKKIIKTIASGLLAPNGVAFHQGALYVAEVNRILRFDNIENKLNQSLKPVILYDQLPTELHHGWRYIAFGPDNKLYIPIGMPCNVCLMKDVRFGTITRMNADGSGFEIYAHGIRNSVGITWDPRTKELWFTDNGRDMMGDNIPPDKLDHAKQLGMHFGFPYYDDSTLPNSDYGAFPAQFTYTPPTVRLPAHVAALGLLFYTGKMFPTFYQDQIFIAEHGSWNRSHKIGYQIVLVHNTQPMRVVPFITGWLQGNEAWGRPVALLGLPDGSLLISDDKAGAIYRVSYQRGF